MMDWLRRHARDMGLLGVTVVALVALTEVSVPATSHVVALVAVTAARVCHVVARDAVAEASVFHVGSPATMR